MKGIIWKTHNGVWYWQIRNRRKRVLGGSWPNFGSTSKAQVKYDVRLMFPDVEFEIREPMK
jgi:hypothetical protein